MAVIGNLLLQHPERWEHAGAFCDKALRESPQNPAAHYGIGMLLALRQQSQDALPHYRIAASGWPENADIRINLALALADVGDVEDAFDQLEAAGRLRPIGAAAYVMIGNLMLIQSRPGDAVNAFTRALAIEPGNEEALRNLQQAQSLRNRAP